MSVTHPTTVRNGIADFVVDQLDGGTTNATGQLIFRTSGDVAIATLDLSNPAFGAAASGIATADTISSESSATAGTATKCTLEDRDNSTIINGSVGTSGEDINMSSNIFGAGDTVSVTALTYTAPA